jgi:uncharacterized protein YqeY
MITKQKLETALHEAMRSNNDLVKRTIRMVLSNIKLTEINLKIQLDEPGIISVIQKEIKSRRETIAEAEKGNRKDVIDATKAEIEVLETFLPEQLSDEKIGELVKIAVEEVHAKTIADMGKVMKILLPRIEGKASNEQISRSVRQLLSK